MKPVAVLALFAATLLMPGALLAEETMDFDRCLNELRDKATENGFKSETLDRIFPGIRQTPRVVELDRSQPELIRTFWQYFGARATQERVDRGRKLLREHKALLNRIHAEFGVRPEYLLAFWGLETNFGSFYGRTPVLDSLATLACEGRRGEFFTSQLMHALQIIAEGSIVPERMVGSWAGAMGHMQFMPSTFTAYALDYDGSGRRDLWNSLPDAFASAANYLSSMGWHDGERWGREVRLPSDFPWHRAGLDTELSISEWARLGVRRADGSPLPDADLKASLLLPSGHKGPAFLVYHNFRIIMRWNRSTYYALVVGYLADRIAGMGQLLTAPPSNERALTRDEAKELQAHLNALGLLDDEPDGIIGTRTRAAIRDFQQQVGIPADGYADHSVLEALKAQRSQ